MPARKSNLVIIRIWDSNLKEVAKNKVSIEDRQVGHISIQTPNCYMSLWPKDITNSDAHEIYGVHAPDFIDSPDTDIIYETNASPYVSEDNIPAKPNLPTVICLYSLNVDAIEARFKAIKEDPDFAGWTLIGNNRLVNKGNAHSCASLAYTLLVAGGIYELISRLNSSHGSLSSSASPAALLGFSQKAKQAELKKFPDTAKFSPFKRDGQIQIYFDIEPKSSYELEKSYHFQEIETIPKSQASCWNYKSISAIGFFATATAIAIAARNESCPELLEDVCDHIRKFTE